MKNLPRRPSARLAILGAFAMAFAPGLFAGSDQVAGGPFHRPLPAPFSAPLPSQPFNYPNAEPHIYPSWVEYGEGLKEMAENHYGEAAVDFNRAIERKGIFPEAEWKLADLAGLDGDPLIKERLLEKALDEAGLLVVPDDRWELLYDLAAVRLRLPSQGLEKKSLAMDTYRQILNQDPDYARLESEGGLAGYDAAFFTRPGSFIYQSTGLPSFTSQLTGLNRVLYLFHHPVDFSLKAHEELARLYLENHAYDQAEVHALYALTAIFSTVIDEVQRIQPDYVFRSLNDLFVNQKSPVFLGVPSGLLSHRQSPGSANPGWLSRWQDIHNFLNSAGTDQTMVVLVRALEGLAEREKLFPAPLGNRRRATDGINEMRHWLKVIFPNSPSNALLNAENSHG